MATIGGTLRLGVILLSLQGAGAHTQVISENPLGLSIHHITVGVANIEVEKKFFHDILGFQVGTFRKRPKYDLQQMQIRGFRVDMIEQKDSIRPSKSMETDKQGWLHIAFTVPKVLPIYQMLQVKGVSVVPGRMDGDQIGSIFVTDPEGNRIELALP